MPRCETCHRRLRADATCPADGGRAAAGQVSAPLDVDIGGFRIDRVLGTGGFSTVWSATRESDGEPVAIKVPALENERSRHRLEQELRALEAAGSPPSPAPIGIVEDETGRACLVMERIDGPTLAGVLEDAAEPFAVAELLELSGAIAAAVELLHAQGLCHGDLKPENIAFVPGTATSARLFDLGGGTAATPAYCAPERAADNSPSPCSDVYSLGAILYEMATLRLPFSGSAAAIAHGHASLRPFPPSRFRPLPRRLERVILDCLAKDPADRPRDAGQLGSRLAQCALGDALVSRVGRVQSAARASAQPAVVAAVRGVIPRHELVSLAEAHGGFVADHHPAAMACVFDATVADPIGAARIFATAAEELSLEIALHLDRLAIRHRDRGAPLVCGAAIDTRSWCPTHIGGTWESDAFRASVSAIHVDSAPLIERQHIIDTARGQLDELVRGSSTAVLAVVGAPGLGKTRISDELVELCAVVAPQLEVVRIGGAGEAAELERLDTGRPIAIVADDAHLLGDEALAALEHAALDGRDAPAFVAVVADPSVFVGRPRWGDRTRSSARHQLTPLSAEGARTLVRELIGAEFLADAVVDQLVQWGAGNPQQLTRLASAVADRDDRHVAPLVAGQLPDEPMSQWLVERDLGALPASLAHLARVCSALSIGFSPEQVDWMSDAADERQPVDTTIGLFALCQRGFLEEIAPARYRVASELARAAAYDGVDPAVRVRIHEIALERWQRIASERRDSRILEAIAHHAAGAKDLRLAAECRSELGALAIEEHRFVPAERHLSELLSLGVDLGGERMVAAYRGRARARLGADRLDEALDDLSEALALCDGAPELSAHVDLDAAIVLDWARRFDESSERVDRAVALGPGESELRARLSVGLGRSAWRRGDAAEAVAHLESALTSADPETRIIALVLLAPALVTLGRLDDAEQRFREAVALCEMSGDRLHSCVAHGNRMVLWSQRKRPDLARADLEHLIALARQLGHPSPERIGSYNLAEDLYWEADDRAPTLARRAKFLHDQFVTAPTSIYALLVARVLIGAGDEHGARAALSEAVSIDPEPADPSAGALASMVAAVLDRASPARWDEICADCEGLSPPEHTELWYWRAVTARRRSDDAEFRAALTRAVELAADLSLWSRRLAELEGA